MSLAFQTTTAHESSNALQQNGQRTPVENVRRTIEVGSAPLREEPLAHETVGAVLAKLLRHPVEHIVRRWNWKSALLSSVMRATLYFTTNIVAGLDAALAAMATEFSYRAVTSGFNGALIQAFRRARPRWRATVTVMILLPAISHTLEWTVHWMRDTPQLKTSIAASVGFTVLSALFNLYAMRRGVLVVGSEGGSLIGDLRRMPLIALSFVAALPVAILNLLWEVRTHVVGERTRAILAILPEMNAPAVTSKK